MRTTQDYWKDIANKLQEEHPEVKAPAEWTRSEAQSFLNKLQEKTEKSISTTTFRRIFKEGHLGKLETKDIFAQYFNYTTHGDYIKNEIKKKQFNWYWLLILPLGVSIVWLSKKAIFPTTEMTTKVSPQINKIIEKAVIHQFDAFKAIPNYSTNLQKLQEIYWTKGSAYQQITSILKRQSNLNWTINNPSNASTAQLINVMVDSIRDDQAFVTTTEHWRLDWFNQSSQRDEYKYEITNEQKYLLVQDKESKEWKILQNNYSGNKFRYIPKYIHCVDIATQTTDLTTIKKRVRLAVENDGLELALRIMDCYFRNNTQQKFPDALSLLLAEKTKLLRAVNTDEIDKTEFEVKKAELFQQVLHFVKKL